MKYAEACGGVGFRCESPDEVGPAMDAAFASTRPALVEAVVDPFEPPMPPQATPKQALHLAESLVRGQPHAGKIATTIFRDKVHKLLLERDRDDPAVRSPPMGRITTRPAPAGPACGVR